MSSRVCAEESSADRTLAAALFRDGKALMEKGDFASACGKLEESQRLDPGGGTILNVALCHEKQGRVATAWAEFIEALGIAKRDHRQGRVDLAEEHIAKLEPQLTKMTIVVPPESDEPSLAIARDGAAVGRAAWGTPFPVDPGEHQVLATATGKLAFRTAVTVGASPSPLTVRIPALSPDLTPAAPSAAEGPAVPAGGTKEPAAAVSTPARQKSTPESPLLEERGAPGGSSQGAWGWAAIGLGGAGVVAGTVLTVLAAGKNGDSKDRCPRDPCDASAVQMSKDAGRLADFATVGYSVGAAALVAGVILLVTDTPARPKAGTRDAGWALYPDGRPGVATVTVRGQF